MLKFGEMVILIFILLIFVLKVDRFYPPQSNKWHYFNAVKYQTIKLSNERRTGCYRKKNG